MDTGKAFLSIDALKEELNTYFSDLRRLPEKPPAMAKILTSRENIAMELEAFAAANPDVPAVSLKAMQMEIIATHACPVIFNHSPFFFELGLRQAYSNGTPSYENGLGNMGAWTYNHKTKSREFNNTPEASAQRNALCYWTEGYLSLERNLSCTLERNTYWYINDMGFDFDHHCLGYSAVLERGVSGLLEDIKKRQTQCCTDAQAIELDAMTRGLQSYLRIAERFAEEAERRLEMETDPAISRNLSRIATAARHVPAHPPRNFYEGLACLWFMREMTATLEGVGMSIIGHPDRQLIHLYQNDLKDGRIDKNEAYELISLWMLPTDIRYDVWNSPWSETSTCLVLGGCDRKGEIVYNDLTSLFLNAHYKNKLINPKLNCRISSSSPQAYLEEMAQMLQNGHNRFAFLNDDVLIPANIRHGKSEEEARLYVAGGCQETVCEGVEHSAGAFFYYNMPAILCDWFRGAVLDGDVPECAHTLTPPAFCPESTFEHFYTALLHAVTAPLKTALGYIANCGKEYANINPCPVFSATLAGCIESATDYSKGGAKYNPSGVCLIGLGNVVNMLNAIRIGVFEEKWTSLTELQDAVRTNWEGKETLRLRMTSHARYGHGEDNCDRLASRLAADLAAVCRSCPNERGEYFQPNFFVYRTFKTLGDRTYATPDGRKAHDMLCQGIAPDRRNAPKSLTQAIKTLSAIDFCDYPGNAIFDAMLPTGRSIPAITIASLIRTFAQMGGPTLQLNCVTIDELKDAKVNPEQHSDLVVRVSGLSVSFVNLFPQMQDEVISRATFAI